jgi:hypothetical protein
MLLSLTFGITVSVLSAETERGRKIERQTEMQRGLNYRSTVVDYLADNPGTPDGVVSDTALAPYAPRGYTPTGDWLHVIDTGFLYVYSAQPGNAGLSELMRSTFSSCRIGIKVSDSEFETFACGRTSMTFPSVIMDGSIVMIGE